jgi:hypothetical protein
MTDLNSTSKAFSLNVADWQSTLLQVVDGCGGIILTAIQTSVIPNMQISIMGHNITSIVVMFYSVIAAHVVRKYVSNGVTTVDANTTVKNS